MVNDKTNGMVNRIGLFGAACAETDRGLAHAARIHLGKPAAARRVDHLDKFRRWKFRGIIQIRNIARLRLDQHTKLLEGAAIGNHPLRHTAAFIQVFGAPANHQHVGADMQTMLAKVSRSAAFQGVDGFQHFKGIADRMSKRLIHIGKQANGFTPGKFADFNHQIGKLTGRFKRFHEGAPAHFNIQHDGIGAGCNLFAHDGGGNQGDGRHGTGHIAQGIQFTVGRREIKGLTGEDDTFFLELLFELLGVQIDAIAGDGFELIQRAAAKAQAATGHFSDRQAAGRDDRQNHKGGLIADTTGRMFVHGNIHHAG